eukprot:m.160568 g.160568  ORF g.160568 m.160568 type:complete len:492 (+) comp14558_c0_seq1:112-1587(+)
MGRASVTCVLASVLPLGLAAMVARPIVGEQRGPEHSNRGAAPITRYFNFRGKATALISSGEHYGALINRQFDFESYFVSLERRNFTLTEAFVGTYVEPDSDADPTGQYPLQNPLSPLNGSFISPWARSSVPAGPKGGNKFDLTQFDEEYFDRLRSFVDLAGRHGIVAQLGLFCGYDAAHEFIWEVNPMNPRNNINDFAAGVNRSTVYTRAAGSAMVAAQTELVKRVVEAVKGADNVLMQLVFTTNGTSPEWADDVLAAVRAADPNRTVVVPVQWMSSLNTDGTSVIASCGAESDCQSALPDGYARPTSYFVPNLFDSRTPSAEVIYTANHNMLTAYRRTYWGWMLSGGGALYNCDWAYTVGHEAGTATYPQASATNSGPQYQDMVAALAEFMRGLPLDAMYPSCIWVSVSGGAHNPASVFGLQSDHDFALFVAKDGSVSITLAIFDTGALCDVVFFDPLVAGKVLSRESNVKPSADLDLPPDGDIVLLVHC